MLKIYFFILLVLTSLHALADEPTIIDVRRNITLSDEDNVYKDFYINVGEGSGLKKNLVVTAVRKLSVRDASGAQAFGEVMIPVGQLRVIAVYNKIAVAREYKLLSRDELPMLEQIGIMTGDKIDLQGSFIDNNKPKYPKRKVAEQPPVSATVTVALVSEAAAAPPKITSTGPAPASVAAPAASQAEVVTPQPQKLEKSADSGNNSAL
jgi:hypothetical protein